MVAQRQRYQLVELGKLWGIRPVFLKAAWADEVLYGGQGRRIGGDIDVLIQPGEFRTYAKALETLGYRRIVSVSHRFTSDFGDKEWSFKQPGGLLPVDLHRGLSEHFSAATKPFLNRVKEYPTPTGSILSLEEEDQVLYCVMHYMGHQFFLDGRHLEDTARLTEAFALNWDEIRRRAVALGMLVPMALLVQALKHFGAASPEPEFFLASGRLARRFRWAQGWVDTSVGLGRKDGTQTKRRLYEDLLYRIPRLKGRPLDPAKTVAKYLTLRLGDWIRG